MALTFEEVKERLKNIDETTLMELLEISSEDLVDRFDDIIEDNFERYEAEVSDQGPQISED
jgi:hypothetical protein